MATLTKFPGTVSQTTGGNYRTFSDLNNIKVIGSGLYATSSANIKGKSSSPNRPSTISCTNFNFNLPTGAEVTKVTVHYNHRKNVSGLRVGSPTITLLGVSGKSVKGVAPTTSFKQSSHSFTGLTRTQVNSSSFGVKIDYPSNTSTSEGTLSIGYVRIIVEYKVPSYTVGVKRASGGYNGEEYAVECSISNKNLTSYNPTLTLSAPAGFSYKRAEGTGTATMVNNRTVTWNPNLTSKVGTSTIRLVFDVNVTYPAGTTTYTGAFSLVESLYSTTGSLTATITDRPVTEEEEGSGGSPIITDDDTSPVPIKWEKLKVNENITVNTSITSQVVVFAFPCTDTGEALLLEKDTPIPDTTEYYYNSFYSKYSYWGRGYVGFDSVDFHATESGKYFIKVYDETSVNVYDWDYAKNLTPLISYFFEAIPNEEDLTTPYFSILEPSEEELNRLGDGYTYIAQSDIKNTTTDTNIRDWYKNNRIGVFNNNIENVNDYSALTNNQIIENALYWSNETAGLNEYNSVECEFTYDSDYPLYVIITGDYPEATAYDYDMGTITYTEPCIIENTFYEGYETNGNYPIPIQGLITDTDSSTITLNPNENSTPIRIYDFPLDNDYGTNESLAIRGIEITATLESTDNLIVYAKIINPVGEIGQRSIVLNNNDTDTFTIGGLGDLWGFTTLQMTNLNNWQIELQTSNILSTSESTLNINNLQITFYIETVDKQPITITIDGEDIAYYGAFIDTIQIPEGLETNTSYITIDGTDMNDAYRQNIKEKTITIDFNISECDLKTSTDLLRQITKLFTNEKDQYNRPIPKRIQFSHYPDDYFEYIMEEAFDVKNEITGYNVQAKLTIPSGTSYSRKDTVTNTVGNANGLAALRPRITIQPSTANIEIKETLSEQKFTMTYPNDWTDKIIEIDCDDRIVLLKDDADDDDGVDISKYVDHNSDWFRLSGEFQFEAINCVIRTVTFNERW